MRQRVLRSSAAALVIALLGVTGCAEPEPGSTTRPTTRRATPAPAKEPGAPAGVRPVDRPYEPGRGRLGQDLLRRHGLPTTALRRSGLGQTILWETFSDAKNGDVPGWRRLGEPVVVVRGDSVQGKWLRLRASKRKGRHGLSRHLPAEEVAGRAVRFQAKILQPGVTRANPSDLPAVRLEWQDAGGKADHASLPLHTYSSPGWETCETYADIPAGAKEVKLTLTPQGATVTMGLDDIWVERVAPAITARVAGTTGQRQNLIDGGDFEVGQRNFSVYGARRVPGRPELRACPLSWSIDESTAAVGKRSLRIPLDREEFRVAFGWVRVVPGKEYVVSLFARSNTKVVLRVGLVEYPGLFRFDYFTVDERFRQVVVKVPISADAPWSTAAVVIRPTDKSKDAYAKGPSHFLWLDGVSLTTGDPKSRYDPPAPVEVGIVGPGFDPAEIAHLVRVGQPADLSVRVTNYQRVAYEGRLAIDVVDAFDRPFAEARRTLKVKVRPGQTDEWKLDPLHLPRGYYKAFVTAWPGVVGRGRSHSTAERAFAVANLTDAVPTGNYFGMTVESPRMSRRITQLGAGWVWLRASRQWCETSAGKLQWSWHQELIERARKQRLEVLADLAWTGEGDRSPTPGDRWRTVCRQFAIAGKGKVEALGVLDQTGVEGLPAEKYAALLGQASAEIRRAIGRVDVLASGSGQSGPDPFARLKQAIKGGLARSAEGLALRFPPTALPEQIEPMLDEVRSWRKAYPFEQYIDVGVGQRGPSAYLHVPNLYGYRTKDAAYRPDVPDPVLHASRLVRAMAIRQFAMIDRAAWWVESHRPPDILRPTVDPQCHEYDNAPRPSLVAFDFMAEMLNPAVLVEWIDLPQQTRALCFERADGNWVILLWRPFGWSLRAVGLRGLAGKVKVFDLFGRRERHRTRGRDLLVMANEAVRYLVVPAAIKEQALQALRRPIRLPTAPATSSRPSSE